MRSRSPRPADGGPEPRLSLEARLGRELLDALLQPVREQGVLDLAGHHVETAGRQDVLAGPLSLVILPTRAGGGALRRGVAGSVKQCQPARGANPHDRGGAVGSILAAAVTTVSWKEPSSASSTMSPSSLSCASLAARPIVLLATASMALPAPPTTLTPTPPNSDFRFASCFALFACGGARGS